MASGERKFTLYTNGEKVREMKIQNEEKKRRKELIEARFRKFEQQFREDYGFDIEEIGKAIKP